MNWPNKSVRVLVSKRIRFYRISEIEMNNLDSDNLDSDLLFTKRLFVSFAIQRI